MKTTLADFDTCLGDLRAAKARLDETRADAEKAGRLAEWEHLQKRVSIALTQIASIQRIAFEGMPMFRNLNEAFGNADIMLEQSAIFALRGGIVAMGATSFAINRFLDRLAGNDKALFDGKLALGGLLQWMAGGLLVKGR